jgi:hypothetical protein
MTGANRLVGASVDENQKWGVARLYRYYHNSEACYVCFSDVPPLGIKVTPAIRRKMLRESGWFTRGWTLQELVAPRRRVFLASDWSTLPATKDERTELLAIISSATGINEDILREGGMLSLCSIARRMSWASRRVTTRSEDIAYSLMGLFDVHMPVLYGEGGAGAFRRLQLAMMQTSFDQTLFAWRRAPVSSFHEFDGSDKQSGLLARSPADFHSTPLLAMWQLSLLLPFSMTNTGLSIKLSILELDTGSKAGETPKEDGIVLADLQCDIRVGNMWRVLVLYVERVPDASLVVNGNKVSAYRRVKCDEWMSLEGMVLHGSPYIACIMFEDEQRRLVQLSRDMDKAGWAKEPPE